MYEILKNRLTNGREFLAQRAKEEIARFAIDMTKEQADELLALAEANGKEILSADIATRMTAEEEKGLQRDAAIMELADMVAGGGM